jgi:hypothetical protein
MPNGELKSFEELLEEHRQRHVQSLRDARAQMRSYALMWRKFREIDPAWTFPIRMAVQLRDISFDRVRRGAESLAMLETDFIRLGYQKPS